MLEQIINFNHKKTYIICNQHGNNEALLNGNCRACHTEAELLKINAHINTKTQQKMQKSNFVNKFIANDFSDYQTNDNPSQILAIETCKRYINNTDAIRNGKSLIFLGSTGVGKTMLSTILVKYLLKANNNINTAQYLKYYQLNTARYPEFNLAKLINTDFLVIDEIGTSNTDFKKDALFEIIDQRYDSSRPTFLISNLSKMEFDNLLSTALKSRLNEIAFCVEIKSRDYREFV